MRSALNPAPSPRRPIPVPADTPFQFVTFDDLTRSEKSDELEVYDPTTDDAAELEPPAPRTIIEGSVTRGRAIAFGDLGGDPTDRADTAAALAFAAALGIDAKPNRDDRLVYGPILCQPMNSIIITSPVVFRELLPAAQRLCAAAGLFAATLRPRVTCLVPSKRLPLVRPAGSTGNIIFPRASLEELRRACERHRIGLVIFDVEAAGADMSRREIVAALDMWARGNGFAVAVVY